MDLAYLKTGISGVLFGVLNFESLYFLGTGYSCCIFRVVKLKLFFKVFHVFNTILGPALFTRCFNNHGLHYYHIMLDFCEMNTVFDGIF